MNQTQFDGLQCWFDGYVAPFCDTDPEGLRNIRLKIDHTARVRENMDILTRGEGLSAGDCLLAVATALLHDVGRFPQYRRWRTFRDSESDNHARMSVDVIREQGILEALDPVECLVIEEAVRFHNQLALPQRMKSGTTLFLRLIRDADKLDIWKVFLEYFTTPELERASATMLGLPEHSGVTPVSLEQLKAGSIVRLETVKCVNDFKLLLVSWVYDLNFSSSYRLVQQNDFLGALSALLPEQLEIASAIAAAREYINLKSVAFSS